MRCASVSTWPYISVDVVGSPSACALRTTSTHSDVVMRPGAMRRRRSSSSTSAEVPGSEPSPASRSSSRYAAKETPARPAPYFTSSGEKAWMWRPGAAALIARQRRT